MELNTFKGLTATLLFIAAVAGGLLPFFLKQRQKHRSNTTHSYSHSDHPSIDQSSSSSTEEESKSISKKSQNNKLISTKLNHSSPLVKSSAGGSSNGSGTHIKSIVVAGAADYQSTNDVTIEPDFDVVIHPIHDMKSNHSSSSTTNSCCRFDVDRFLSLGNMFSAGIFLGGGLMHLLPESHSGILKAQETWNENLGFLRKFPIAFFLCGFGFFTILVVEEVTIAITSRKKKPIIPELDQLDSLTNMKDGTTTSSSPHTHHHHHADLARSIVQGMTQRTALITPGIHIHHHEKIPPIDSINPVQTGDAESDYCDLDDYDSTTTGPIQSFLDASRGNSPSPFPSFLDPVLKSKSTKSCEECKRATREDEEEEMKMAAAAAAAADIASEPVDSSPSHHPSYSPSSRTTSSNSAVTPAAQQAHGHRTEDEPLSILTAHSIRQPLLPSTDELSPSSSSSASPPLPSFPSPSSPGLLPFKSSLNTTSNKLLKSIPAPATNVHGHGNSAAENGHGHGHGGGGGHDDHSHIDIQADTSYIVAYLLVMALSFHSIFEGIALGTQQDVASTLSIFIVIMAHSPLAGFALGVSLVKSKAGTKMVLSCLFIFGAMTPTGTCLGMLLSALLTGDFLTTVSSVFQAFSAGTFLFVALEEVIPKEMAVKKDKAWKLILMIIGFLLMSVVKIFDSD